MLQAQRQVQSSLLCCYQSHVLLGVHNRAIFAAACSVLMARTLHQSYATPSGVPGFLVSWETSQWHSWHSSLMFTQHLTSLCHVLSCSCIYVLILICTRSLKLTWTPEHQPSPTMPPSTVWILTFLCSWCSLELWVPSTMIRHGQRQHHRR